MSKSNALENLVLDHFLGTTQSTFDSSVYLALHTQDPAEDATGAELSATGYARSAITFNSASGGSATGPDSAIEYTNSGVTSWAEVTHFAIWTALTGGTMLYYGSLSTPKTIAAGDTLRFTADSITITEA